MKRSLVAAALLAAALGRSQQERVSRHGKRALPVRNNHKSNTFIDRDPRLLRHPGRPVRMALLPRAER